MKNLSELPHLKWTCVFTDIDGTLTHQGQIGPGAYQSLWNLRNAGIHVVPVTGRPAGWCEMIARTWPVLGVIGENGAFYFSLKGQKMHRKYLVDQQAQRDRAEKFDIIKANIAKRVPGAAIASDQFTRMYDLAIDFAEDVPVLTDSDIREIVVCFKEQGATAKVSNIHVNGWFGEHDKLSACREFCQHELAGTFDSLMGSIAFIGDSPNDEPMFRGFRHSFAVQNIEAFKNELKHLPAYVTTSPEGDGFVEFTEAILKSNAELSPRP